MGTATTRRTRPFLKWAGGKTQLLSELASRLPARFGRYYEPFAGGAALFFAVQPDEAVISDSNAELINCYQVVRDDVEALIDHLKTHVNEEDYFYELRGTQPSMLGALERASRMIYLNRTCFNGLYRVNAKGVFNTPYGRYKNPSICDEGLLREASAALESAELVASDYHQALVTATRGDFVYLDPPYIPVSESADFKRYTKSQFREDDHRRLAQEYRRLGDAGCKVLLSNSWHPLVEELYSAYTIEQVSARRIVNCDASKRGPVPEAIIRNYG